MKICFCGHKVDTLRMRLDEVSGSYLCVDCGGQVLAPIDTVLGQQQRQDLMGEAIEASPIGLRRGAKK